MFRYSLLKALQEEREKPPLPEFMDVPAERGFSDDMSEYSLGIRRKRAQLQMKQMLNDAGYEDLARMSTITKGKRKGEEDEY